MHMYTRDDPDEGLAWEALVAMTTRVQSSAIRVDRRDMKEGERRETAAHWQFTEESPLTAVGRFVSRKMGADKWSRRENRRQGRRVKVDGRQNGRDPAG